jgi:3-isopropylmalate/(R)-2-methylmalate dehydratase small subunit
MSAFPVIRTRATPLLVDNIDTDVITPIGRVLEGREAMVKFAFEPMRFDSSGALRADCPLNDPAYAGSQVLIAGDNFACGSSRETAVWAVKGIGFRAVIAPSFGDIFYSNCPKNGVLPISLPLGDVQALANLAERGAEIQIDLSAQRLTSGDLDLAFAIAPLRKEGLLLGLDELGLIERRRTALDRFEQDDRVSRPWVYL